MSDPLFLAGQTLPAGELQDLGEYGTWVPTLGASTTAPTLGTGSVSEGRYHRNGRVVFLWFNITFGTSGTSAGTGTYRIQDLPFPIDSIGAGTVVNSAVRATHDTTNHFAFARVQSTTQFTLLDINGLVEITATTEAWDASDFFRGSISYLATT